MARHKEFNRETVLNKATGVFSNHGFEGTSTDDLLKAMGISRQSMYDTFGDKWKLYLEALQSYAMESVQTQIAVLNAERSPTNGVRALLENMVRTVSADAAPACLGISAICEFGQTKPELRSVMEISSKRLLSALEMRISEAIETKEASPDLLPSETAQFLLATLTGIKVAGRSGASSEALYGIVRTALRSFH